MALNYSPKSAQALAYLKNFYNDVEIFVEFEQVCSPFLIRMGDVKRVYHGVSRVFVV